MCILNECRTHYKVLQQSCVCVYEKVINILMFLVVFFLLLFKCVKLGVFKCSPLLLKKFWVAKKFPYLCCCCWYQRLLWSIITYVDGENLKIHSWKKRRQSISFFSPNICIVRMQFYSIYKSFFKTFVFFQVCLSSRRIQR